MTITLVILCIVTKYVPNTEYIDNMNWYCTDIDVRARILYLINIWYMWTVWYVLKMMSWYSLMMVVTEPITLDRPQKHERVSALLIFFLTTHHLLLCLFDGIQATSVCFWAITTPVYTYGEFFQLRSRSLPRMQKRRGGWDRIRRGNNEGWWDKKLVRIR